MQRRVARTIFIFTALTLILATFLFSTQETYKLPFKPSLPFQHSSDSSDNDSSDIDSHDFTPPETVPEYPPDAGHRPNPWQEEEVTASAELEITSSTLLHVASQSSNTPTEAKTTALHPAVTSTSAEKTYTDQKASNTSDKASHPKGNQTEDTLLVEILESNGWHEEVLAALVYGFGSQPQVQLGLYQAASRFRIADIMANFSLSHTLPKYKKVDAFKDVPESARQPDIVVSTTCELDLKHLDGRLSKLLKRGKTFLYCVVHHGDQWRALDLQKAASPWIEKDLMDFVCLSNHTAKFLLEEGVKGWQVNISRPIKRFVPLFPVTLSAPTNLTKIKENHELPFALQGNYQAWRRDFNGIFSKLQSFIEEPAKGTDHEKEDLRVTLHLLGSGDRPKVPQQLSEHVFFDEDLSYPDFYSILSQMFALLPAFADDSYLDRKASSSIPASLMGSVPLVANRELLDAYNYLSEDAVYLREKDETEIDVVGRILKTESKARKQKAKAVQQNCATIMKSNVATFAGWVEEAAARIGQ